MAGCPDSGDQRGMFSSRSTRASLLVNQFCCSVSRHSKRAKQQLALEDAVDLDLPILSNKTRSVRGHDLDSLTVVNEPGRLGHSAIRVDVELWRQVSCSPVERYSVPRAPSTR